MKFSEETLMAYADGELGAEARAAVEAAMAADPEIARRVARQLSLAGRVRAAFDPVLREAVPDRLKDAAAEPGAAIASAAAGMGAAIDLTTARAAKLAPRARTWSWPRWTAIAASVLAGMLAGRMVLPDLSPSQFALERDGFVARGALERALSTQLASTQTADAPVRIGISFLSKSGRYCRTFSLSNGLAGLGCKAGSDWHLEVVAQSDTGTRSPGAYRMAAGEAPAAITREVEERIVGSSLDARAEEAALRSGWLK